MFESSYLIDPGSHTLRLYDPKTRSVLSLPACRLEHWGNVVGEDALSASWSENDRVVWPFFREKMQSDPGGLLKELFRRAPADRFVLVPSVHVLSFQAPDEATVEAWNRRLESLDLGSVQMIPAFIPQQEDAFFHIHAGHSLVHFVMGKHQEVLAYQALPIAGLSIDQAIAQEIARVFKVLITMEDACALKETISAAFASGRNPQLQVTGLDQHSQYERLSFKAMDLWGCIERVLLDIARSAAEFVCIQGPELMEEVLAHPVFLSGGLALCFGLSPLLERSLHAPVNVVENPETWLLDTVRRYRRPRFGSEPRQKLRRTLKKSGSKQDPESR